MHKKPVIFIAVVLAVLGIVISVGILSKLQTSNVTAIEQSAVVDVASPVAESTPTAEATPTPELTPTPAADATH